MVGQPPALGDLDDFGDFEGDFGDLDYESEIWRGMRLVALPGKTLQAHGRDYNQEGDKGRIVDIWQNDIGLNMFSIAWERTGLISHSRVDRRTARFAHL